MTMQKKQELEGWKRAVMINDNTTTVMALGEVDSSNNIERSASGRLPRIDAYVAAQI